MAKAITSIYDVAKAAGVSTATVSRVLNSPQRVSPATRSAVIDVMERLNYPHPAAAATGGAVRRIGVLTPYFTEPSFTQRLRGIAGVLYQNNYDMVIYPVDTKARQEEYLQTLPLRRSVDGLIVVAQAIDGTSASRLRERGLQTVFLEYSTPEFSTIEIDDVSGGLMATQFLLGIGHRRIAFLGHKEHPIFGLDPIKGRLKGYCQALEEARVSVNDNLIFEVAPDPAAVLRQLTRESGRCAVFAATDLQAVALLKAAREMELRVPKDLAVIGFDDIDMADYFGLTTVRQPLDESGRIAADLLVARLADPRQTIQHIRLPLSIVVRDTV